MAEERFDLQATVERAEEAVQKAAQELHDILVAMAGELVPFPYFLGSIEVRAIEAEPGGAERADRGCIVVCPDGEMYEFTMRFQPPGPADIGMDRDDSVKRVELPPRDYIAYAYNAVKEMAGLLAEREGRARKYSY